LVYLGAAFGFGFLIGPAIGGLLSSISLAAPFWFSAVLAFVGAAFGYLFLPETLDKTHIERKALVKPHNLITALTSPSVGLLLIITFIVSVGQNAWIIGFQSFTVDILKLSAQTIGLIFSLVGLVGIVMQGVGVKWIIKLLGGMRQSLQVSLLLSGINLILISLVSTVTPFVLIVLLSGVFGAAILPVLSALITQNTRPEDQGGMLGISQSYTSLGQIIGPLLAGLVIAWSMDYVFILAGGLMLVSFIASLLCGKRCEQRVDL
jgi:predicted MFS family arabinose efflux permease